MRLFPAIDIRGGRCVRLIRGRGADEIRYGDDPLEAAARWVRAGATWLHIVDLGAALGEAPSTDAVLRILRELPVPAQVGGGLRDLDAIDRILRGGARRVFVGTRALSDPDFLAEAVSRFGGAKIYLAVDVAGDRVRIGGWTEATPLALEDALRLARDAGAGGALLTAIDRDGTLSGPRADLVRRAIGEAGLPVIAAGGIGAPADLESLVRLDLPGLEGIVVGRALYEGRVTIEDGLRIVEGVEPLAPAIAEAVRFDARGLVVAIVQDVADGAVLMVAYMNRESLRRTLAEGVACFWSRSRREFWVKGATSGNTQEVVDVRLDCDGDAILVRVRPRGPACHTGARTCFFRRADPKGTVERIEG
ncbi:MAG: phosphoribosyl-AMP cyclohydrolase [Planctomycetes bacterium]|nr:phosphoribosyl-AMP cyclohydrolase [Planctomycetota bacterium]